jgi:nicotinate-nucleotide pyrophosphorylase (carboxylating)
MAEARAMTFALPGFDLDAFVAATLAEDLGGPPGAGGRDLTSESVIPADAVFAGVMDSRDAATIAGLPIAAAFFRALDPAAEIEILVEEGANVRPGADLMRITGNARAMLTAERSALNTVQHLTGIATMTRDYVKRIAGTGTTLLDTRKTIPGLRLLEKYATRMGGAQNHRMGLWDAAMIKDNHVAVAGSSGSSSRWTASTRSSLPSRRAPPICCSTIWSRRCCAARSRWSAGGCRPKHRAGCGSTPSAPSPRPA